MTNPEDCAVVVGISAYTNLPNLERPSTDARTMVAWLTDPDGGGLSAEHVRLVTSDSGSGIRWVTRKDIDEAFYFVAQRMRPPAARVGPRLYIYLSGHGVASRSDDVALLMAEASRTKPGPSIGAMAYASYFIDVGMFDEVVLLVDCDRSVDMPFQAGHAGAPPWARFETSGRATRALAGFSSALDDVGHDTEGLGAFTHAVVDGLSGGAADSTAAITSETLVRFVITRVADLTKGRQTPAFRFEGLTPIVFRPPSPIAEKSQPPVSVVLTYPTPRIESDRWAEADALGHEPFARTVASLITHDETIPPLTIGIKAPWGAGKTSLMKRVQYLLDGDARVTEENESAHRNQRVEVALTLKQLLAGLRVLNQPAASLPPVNTTTKSREDQQQQRYQQIKHTLEAAASKVADIGGRLDSALRFEPPKPVQSAAGAARDIPSRVTVRFNAWKYQTSEQIWAGLAHCIISQVTARMTPVNRELFWLKLHVTRVDVNQVRSKARAIVLRDLIPWFVGCGAFLAMGAVLVALDVFTLGLIGVTVAPLLAVGRYVYAWTQKLGEKVSGTLRDLVREPDYEGKLGFLHLVESDIREVGVRIHDRPVASG